MKAPRQQRDLIPAGTHIAICYCVVDLGTHEITYPGQQPEDVRQILIIWELPNCRMDSESDGQTTNKPRVKNKKYRFSSYKKANLAIHVTSWTGGCGDDFDYESLIGKPCQLSIVHEKAKSSDTIYDNIGAVIQLPEGMPQPALENPTIYYSMEEHGRDFPESMSGENYKWIREIIEKSAEFEGMERAAEAIKNPAPRSDDEGPLEDTGEDYDAENPDNLPF